MPLTELEARDKACCKTIPARDTNGSLQTPACLASGCMAWRWETKGHTLKNVLIDGVMTERFSVDIRTTRGYCGLAAEPHSYDLLESELASQEDTK